MTEQRPDPDKILEKVKVEEEKKHQGKLKIFFGYAAGVGKTYAMLQSAHLAIDMGIDVVAGYVEPHERPETANLACGIETLLPLIISYKNIKLREFDLDGALKRNPQLILVDELAHSNAVGCRHRKRYQDIQELLKAGIDVYTTVNVQHIESLNDMVASITGVVVQERIPDFILDDALKVELVDIEPEELMERLREGKVYRETQVNQAIGNFFTTQNLTALREIALRRIADQVNRQTEKSKVQIQGNGYFTDEHILICVSASPSNGKVIRSAGRMAQAFHARFTAAYVEPADQRELPKEQIRQLKDNMHLAEQMGGKVITLYGNDMVEQIADYSRISGVSKIVLGRSNTKRNPIFRSKTFSELLVEQLPNVEIFLIPDATESTYKNQTVRKGKAGIFTIPKFKSSSMWLQILGIGIALAILLLCVGMIKTTIFVLVVDFITVILVRRAKYHEHEVVKKAYRTEVLLETSEMLQEASDMNRMAFILTRQIQRLLKRDVVFYTTDPKDGEEPLQAPVDQKSQIELLCTPDERGVAAWSYRNSKHAGASTNTLPGSNGLYLAVRNAGQAFGVVGIHIGERELSTFEKNILIALLSEGAMAFEKASSVIK